MASEVKLVDMIASARTPGVSSSIGVWESERSTYSMPATPPNSTSTGMTIASSSCSPLRSSSRVSMRGLREHLTAERRGPRAAG